MNAGCALCRDVGWTLDTNRKRALTLELIPCPAPDCDVSGQPVEHLAFKPSDFTRAVQVGDRIVAVSR